MSDDDEREREIKRLMVINAFNDERVRRGFIRKVYSILMFQLLLTFGSITFVMYNEEAEMWILEHLYLYIVAIVVVLVTMLTMVCCGDLRRKTPHNYILLFVFTLAEAFLVTVFVTLTREWIPLDTVWMAIGITALVVIVLTLFAMQNICDFTACGGFLAAALMIFVILTIVAMFFPSRTMITIQASIGVLLFSAYLIYDTQLIMGGNSRNLIDPEEYVFAALCLYLDIINLFMYILILLGLLED